MTTSFWTHDHPLSEKANELRALIPMVGEITGKENAKLERFRKVMNAYYKLNNDGQSSGFFRRRRNTLGRPKADDILAQAVIDAYAEQFGVNLSQ